MRDYQPWDDSWNEQLVYITLPYQLDAPVEMPSNFPYPLFLGAIEKKLGGDDFWKAIAGSMVYILGHQPSHHDSAKYIHWLNEYSPDIFNEILYDGAEQASQGKLETAIWLFQAAVLLDPQKAEAHFNLGLAYYQLGLALAQKDSQLEAESCFRQAAQYLENAVSLDSQLTLAYYNLGFIYKQLGLQEESQKNWERGILLGLDKANQHSLERSNDEHDIPGNN